MAKVATRKEKTERIKNTLLGVNNEPSFSPLNSSKAELAKGLNFYSLRDYEPKDSKAFALEWAKVERPDLFPILKSASEHAFENRGFVCRMIARGFVLDDKEEIKHISFFEELCEREKKREKEPKAPTTKAVSKKTLEGVANPTIDSLEYGVDAVLSGKVPENLELDAPKANLKEASDRVQSILADLEFDSMQEEKQYLPSKADALKAYLTRAFKEIEQRLVEPVKRVVKAISPAVAKSKAQETDKKLVSKLVVSGAPIKGVSLSALVGKKTVILYNIKSRALMVFNAQDDSGLSIKGMSILGCEEAKVKQVSSPADFFKATKPTFSEYMKAFLTIKSSSVSKRIRLNEDMIVLGVSR